MQIPLYYCLNHVETRNVDIEPEFTKGDHAVSAGLNVPAEFIGEGNQCDGGESPSHGGGDLKQEPTLLSCTQTARSSDVHRLLIVVAHLLR